MKNKSLKFQNIKEFPSLKYSGYEELQESISQTAQLYSDLEKRKIELEKLMQESSLDKETQKNYKFELKMINQTLSTPLKFT